MYWVVIPTFLILVQTHTLGPVDHISKLLSYSPWRREAPRPLVLSPQAHTTLNNTVLMYFPYAMFVYLNKRNYDNQNKWEEMFNALFVVK